MDTPPSPHMSHTVSPICQKSILSCRVFQVNGAYAGDAERQSRKSRRREEAIAAFKREHPGASEKVAAAVKRHLFEKAATAEHKLVQPEAAYSEYMKEVVAERKLELKRKAANVQYMHEHPEAQENPHAPPPIVSV